jgi:RNA polymerase sigma factor (sigma-70 family)
MADGNLRTLVQYMRRTATPHRSASLSDGQLLERFLSYQDEAAFEVLVWRHGSMVFDVCRRLLRHQQDAEDAFQATFLILVRKAHSIGRSESLSGWLYKVAYRSALAARNRLAAHPMSPLIEVAGPETTSDLVWRDLRPVLDEEVQHLPEKYRTPFVLCYLEGKTNEEAAQQLGCPKGTILSRLARARERLRLRLSRRGVALSAAALATALTEQASAASVPGAVVHSLVDTALTSAAGIATAGTLSVPVGALIEGVLHSMLMAKVKIAAVMLILVSAAALGTGLFSNWTHAADDPQVQSAAPPATQAVGAGATNALPQVQGNAEPVRPPAREQQQEANRIRSMNNLKQIGLAMHNYMDVSGHFPAPAIYSKTGKALLSWRVAILPYLEQDALYRQFHLDEPWDSPHNKRLLGEMPRVYAVPDNMNWIVSPETNYQVFVGPGAGFEKRKGMRIGDLTDGMSNTILAIEASTSVPWTKPEDLEYEPEGPLPELGGMFPQVFPALMFDGSVHTFPKKINEGILRALITRAGGEVVPWDKERVASPERRAREPGDSLQERQQRLQRELVSAREELETLHMAIRKAREAAEADEATLKMMAENRRLEAELEKTRQAIQQARQTLEQLQRKVEKRVQVH